ncbi:MAG: tol-pal system protein YbgF [Burkholderiales bacterium]|nr:tol-pal system protein YbgF [Burkholderiales bacterium]
MGSPKLRTLLGALMFCSGVLATGPAAAGLFDDEIARKQIAEQQKRVDELRQQSDGLAARLTKIEDDAKAQPVLALASEIEKLREEMRSLRGQIEVLGNTIEGVSKRQRDMYVDLDQRLRRFEQPGAAIAPAAAGSAPAAAGAEAPKAAVAAPGTTTGVDENEAYERAQGQRRIGNYQGAITAFQGFVAKYPKSTLAPRAQYWIGDSYFNLRDFRNAIASQQKLIAAYPDSSSVPDALLNMASSQLEAGDTAAARKTMDGLIARYPSSEAAEKARRRVANLR